MNKLLYLLAVLTVGLLGSTPVHAQKNGQYVLDDNGYYIAVVDKDGSTKLVAVAAKDVPWSIRFNPSSTLAGIIDKRTSPFRKLKIFLVAPLITSVIVNAILQYYKDKKRDKEAELKAIDEDLSSYRWQYPLYQMEEPI